VTQIAFHFGAPDKLAYASRLLRKAHTAGAKLKVLGNEETVNALDQLLWALSATDFVPHCRASSSASMRRHSAILLTAGDGTDNDYQSDVLLNLKDDVPTSAGAFGRVIEVVSADENDRHLARGRWKKYSSAGYAITRHDVAIKG
jgi:DNA polymerase-3 subunit chi